MPHSTLETLKHSRRVDELMMQLVQKLQARITKHDLSKMEEPEHSIFAHFHPSFGKHPYGSDSYKDVLHQMQDALRHHYASNRHHPEHHATGIDGMTLVDLAEMLADWKAATERQEDGDLARSFEIQKDRFNISDQLLSILKNTAIEEGWLIPSVE